MDKRLICLLSLLLAAPAVFAKPCSMHASDLSIGGQPLTYDKARTMRGAIAIGDTVHIGPVILPNGFNARVAIEPDGCAHVVNMLSPHS